MTLKHKITFHIETLLNTKNGLYSFIVVHYNDNGKVEFHSSPPLYETIQLAQGAGNDWLRKQK